MVLQIVLIILIILCLTVGYIRLPTLARKAPGYFEYTVEYINNVLKSMKFLIEHDDEDLENEETKEWYNTKLFYDKIEKLIYRWYTDLKVIREHAQRILEYEFSQNITDKFLTDIFTYVNSRPVKGIYVTNQHSFIKKVKEDKEYKKLIIKLLASTFQGKINNFLADFDEYKLRAFIDSIITHCKSKNVISDSEGDDVLSKIASFIREDKSEVNRKMFDKVLKFQKEFLPYLREYTCSGFTNVLLIPVALTKTNIFINVIRRQPYYVFIKEGTISLNNGCKLTYNIDKNTLIDTGSCNLKNITNIDVVHEFKYKTLGDVLIYFLHTSYPNKDYEIRFSSKSKATGAEAIVNRKHARNITQLFKAFSANSDTSKGPEDLDIIIWNLRKDKEESSIIADSIREQLYPIVNASYSIYDYNDEGNVKKDVASLYNNLYTETVQRSKENNSDKFPIYEFPIYANPNVIGKKDDITDKWSRNINNVYMLDFRKTGYNKLVEKNKDDHKHNYHGRRKEFEVDWKLSSSNIGKILDIETQLSDIKKILVEKISIFFQTFKEIFDVDFMKMSVKTGLTLDDPEDLLNVIILFLVPCHCSKADTKGLSRVRYIFEEIEAPKEFIQNLDNHLDIGRVSESVFSDESAEKFQTCLKKLYEVMHALRNYRLKIQSVRNPKIVNTVTYAKDNGKIDSSTFNYDDNKFHALLLDMYLNNYLVGPTHSDKCLQKHETADDNMDNFSSLFDGSMHNSLNRMTRMRTIGGPFNMELTSIYALDLSKYIFIDKQREIWVDKLLYKGPGASTRADSGNDVQEVPPILYWTWVVRDFMISEKTLKFFWNLPAFVTGSMERFKNNEHFSEDYMSHLLSSMERYYTEKYSGKPTPVDNNSNSGNSVSNEDGEEVVETFVGAIMNIGKAFVAIGQVFLSIVNVLTDPIAFILFLICWIVSLILFFMWILIYLNWAIWSGYVLVTLWLIIVTLLWIIVYIAFITILAIVGVIDAFLGNFILKSLRCENYPDAWHTMHNYVKGNRYARAIVCLLPCVKGYSPAGMFCYKQSKSYPLYAPHQVIFNTYLRNDFISSALGKTKYKERPNFRTYSVMSNDERYVFWKESYLRRDEFLNDSIRYYEDYENLVEATCQHLLKKGGMSEDDVNREEVRYMCQSIFCRGNTDNSVTCKTPTNIGVKYDQDNIWIILLKLIAMVLIVYMGLASITGTNDDEKKVNKNTSMEEKDVDQQQELENIQNSSSGMMPMMPMMMNRGGPTSVAPDKPDTDKASEQPGQPGQEGKPGQPGAPGVKPTGPAGQSGANPAGQPGAKPAGPAAQPSASTPDAKPAGQPAGPPK